MWVSSNNNWLITLSHGSNQIHQQGKGTAAIYIVITNMSCSLFFSYHSNYLNSNSFRYLKKKSSHKINSETIDRCLKYNQPIRIFSLPMISDSKKKKKRTNRIPKPSSIFFLMKKPISDKHYLIFFRKFHLALNPYDSLVAKLYLPS